MLLIFLSKYEIEISYFLFSRKRRDFLPNNIFKGNITIPLNKMGVCFDESAALGVDATKAGGTREKAKHLSFLFLFSNK